MKKFFTFGTALALCLSMGAEEIKTIYLGEGIPGMDSPQLQALGISSDGRFVCGSIEYGMGVAIYDLQNNTFNYELADDSELRKIDNNGVGIGFMGDLGVTYSWNGEISHLEVPDAKYKYVLGEDITADGRLKVGSLVAGGYITLGAYSLDGGEWTLLPELPADQLGPLAEDDGCSAKAVSDDGKYIIGHAGSFGPIVMWIRDDNGAYQPDVLFSRFVAFEEDELEEKPLAGLSPVGISPNGKYVLCSAVKYVLDGDSYDYSYDFPAVYDTESGTLKLYDEPQEIDEIGLGITGSAIADDGTFVGIIGTVPMMSSVGTFVMKPGQTQAETLIDAYPKYAELFAMSDMMGCSVPTDISADGSRILGYAYYSEDFDDFDQIPYFLSYVIEDKGPETAVEAVEAVSSDAKEIYSLDGVRLPEMKKGLNIVRMSDGTVRKVMKK